MTRPSLPALDTGTRKAVAGLLVLALLATLVVLLRGGAEPRRATVFLPRAVHLYAGSDVVVLGVRVGEVERVRPEGDRVRVDLTYDPDRKIPADAQAVLVSPTLVADRYVQLTPIYDGGPVLEDGATIPLERGQVPVELDQVFSALRELADALGPDGANAQGALSDLVTVGADNLRGNGAAAGSALGAVSEATDTLADNRQQLFDTVRSLQQLTTELAERDAQVRTFTADLAAVSGQLAGEREELGQALSGLAGALGKVSDFLRDNRAGVKTNVEQLASVAQALSREKESIGKVLDIAPTGIGNFAHLYDPQARALTGRINGNDKYETPAYFLCSMVAAVGVDPATCPEVLGPLADLELKPPSGRASAGPDRLPVPADSLAGILTASPR